MAKLCILLLIGLPGAGKTHFCNQLADKLSPTELYKCYTVVYDDIIGRNFENLYKELRNQAFKVAEDIIKSILQSEDKLRKHVIIIDDNMYYRSMRYEYYKLAKKYELSFLQIYFNIELETTIARNNSREEKFKVPEAVVRTMAHKLEKPGTEQWELNSVNLNSDCDFDETTFTNIIEAIDKSTEQPLRYIKEKIGTATLPKSKLQNIDLFLRKIVHKKLQGSNSDSALCVLKRKEVFRSIKEGKIVISDEWNEHTIYEYLESLI